jgi:hypothetical protein
MRAMRWAVVFLALVLAGCGPGASVQQPWHRNYGAPEVHAAWRSCAADQHPPKEEYNEAVWSEKLATDFAPVAIVVCLTISQPGPSGGTIVVATEKRADDVAAFTAAMRLPDEKRSKGVSCTDELIVVPWFALLDAQNQWVHPGVPTDVCGKPLPQFRDAYAGLRLTTVSSHKVDQVTASAAGAADCDLNWADMISVAAQDAAPASRDITSGLATGPPVTVCVYRVPPAEKGSSRPAGTFVAGTKLTDGQWNEIMSLLPENAPAKPCTTPAARFALIRPGGFDQIYVELDGCHRLLSVAGDHLLNQAPRSLIAVIEAAVG